MEGRWTKTAIEGKPLISGIPSIAIFISQKGEA